MTQRTRLSFFAFVAVVALAGCSSAPAPAPAPPVEEAPPPPPSPPPPPPPIEEQTPPSPLLIPFGDNHDWIVAQPMVYTIGSTTERVVVPRGFVTDFASIPPALAPFGLTPHGQYSRAAIVHDYLYWSQGCTRAQADRLMVIAMKESGTGGFDEFAIYRGVDLGGGGAWAANTRARAAGVPRIVPDEFIPPADPNVNWTAYREMLVKRGVQDPPFPPTPSYCVYGNSTRVP
jgi:hypothetical protein